MATGRIRIDADRSFDPDRTPFGRIRRMFNELVERVELRDVQIADRDIHIAQVEGENARLADRAIRATRERDRAERRVAELELQLHADRISRDPVHIGYDRARRSDAAAAALWPIGDLRIANVEVHVHGDATDARRLARRLERELKRL